MSLGDAELLRLSRAELVAEARARGLRASGWETREELLKLLGVRPPAPLRGLVARAREILQVAREALGLRDLVFDSRIEGAERDRPWARTRAEEAAEQARIARAAQDMDQDLVAADASWGADAAAAATPGLAADFERFAAALGTGEPAATLDAGAAAVPAAGEWAAPGEPASPAEDSDAAREVGGAAAAVDAAPDAGADFVAATARDERQLYVTWQLTAAGVARARAKLGEPGGNGQVGPLLRLVLWDLGAEAERRVEDHPLPALEGETTLTLPAGGAVYVAAVGLGVAGERFAPAAHCPRGSTEGPRHEAPLDAAPYAAATPEEASPDEAQLTGAVGLEPRVPGPTAAALPTPRLPRAGAGTSIAAQRRSLRREERRRTALRRRERDDRPAGGPAARARRERERRGGGGGPRR
jgi:hypothetical protein